MVNVKQLITFVILMATCPFAYGQVVPFTEQQIVDSAVKNSPMSSAAQFQVLQQQQLRKTAFNLSNPELVAESPTGDFYTVGVLQSLDFPTVYLKQNQVYRQQEQVAVAGQQVTQNDVKYQAKLLYLKLQFLTAEIETLKVQDSLYAAIKDATNRQFVAGQIDFLQKTYAEAQYGEVHNKLIQVQSDFAVAQQQLQIITGIRQPIIPAPFQRTTTNPGIAVLKNDTNLFAMNPLVSYYRQQQLLSRRMISLERNRMLPGLVIGYLNQGPVSTPVNMRFRAGITIPLWFWQYNGAVHAARFRFMESEQLYRANQQKLSGQQLEAQGNYFKYKQSVDYYQSTGLNLSESLLQSSIRFYTSGQYDLVTHLRNMNDAYSIQLNYLEALNNFNQSVIYINYINGTL